MRSDPSHGLSRASFSTCYWGDVDRNTGAGSIRGTLQLTSADCHTTHPTIPRPTLPSPRAETQTTESARNRIHDLPGRVPVPDVHLERIDIVTHRKGDFARRIHPEPTRQLCSSVEIAIDVKARSLLIEPRLNLMTIDVTDPSKASTVGCVICGGWFLNLCVRPPSDQCISQLPLLNLPVGALFASEHEVRHASSPSGLMAPLKPFQGHHASPSSLRSTVPQLCCS